MISYESVCLLGIVSFSMLIVLSLGLLLWVRYHITDSWWIKALFVGCFALICSCVCMSINVCHLYNQQELLNHSISSESNNTIIITTDSRPGIYGSTADGYLLCSREWVPIQLRFNERVRLRCWDLISAQTAASSVSSDEQHDIFLKGKAGRVRVVSFESQGYAQLFSLPARIRAAGLEALSAMDNTEASSLIAALVYADRFTFSESQMYQDMRSVGLAHIAAVSGAHLALMTYVIGILLARFPIPARARIFLSMGSIVLFVLCTGMPLSAIRAGCMALISLLALNFKRVSSPLVAWGVCVGVMVLISPTIVHSLSFQLSVAATLGIIMGGEYITRWIEVMMPLPHGVSTTLGSSLCALFTTLPITIPVFAQIPLIALVANCLATIPFIITCVLGMTVTLCCACFPSAVFLLSLLEQVSQGFIELIHALSLIPFASIPYTAPAWLLITLCALIALAWYIRWPTPHMLRGWAGVLGVAILFGCLIFVIPHTHGYECIALDVGQGDAIVIRDGSHAALIDTGTHDAQVLAGLARHNITSLDAVIITHPDDDHCGSLPALLHAVSVSNIMVHQDLLTCNSDNCKELANMIHSAHVEPLRRGDTIHIGSIKLQVLSPLRYQHEGGNEDSLVLMASFPTQENTVSVLLTGDAEAPVLEQLDFSAYTVDILKVPHHGSKKSVTPQLLQEISPRVALISVGKENRYGHPSDEALDVLDDSRVEILRTDELSDITCSISGDTILVE